METHGCRGSRRFAVCLAWVLLAVSSPLALAATPPSASQTPIPVQIPLLGQSVTINLRDLGGVAGTPPLKVEGPLGIYVAGIRLPSIGFIQNVRPEGDVCLTIDNVAFLPVGGELFELEFALSSLSSPTPVLVRVPLANTPGPTTTLDAAACADPNTPPNIVGPQAVSVIDDDPIVFDFSGTSDSDPGNILTYTLRIFDSSNEQLVFQTTGGASLITVNTDLQAGEYFFSFEVSDDSGASNALAAAGGALSILPIGLTPPTVDAGLDFTVPDSNGLPGEIVVLNGNVIPGTTPITNIEWLENGQVIGPGPSLGGPLTDGVHNLTLRVTAGIFVITDTVVVTVLGPAVALLANAGPDQTIADTDGQPGESVTLTGTSITGRTLAFSWGIFDGEVTTPIGNTASLTTNLPDGVTTLRFTVTDLISGVIEFDEVVITIGAPIPRVVLGELPDLTPGQRQIGGVLDRICAALDALVNSEAELTAEQQATLARCQGILNPGNTNQNRVAALDEAAPDDFALARVQTLTFSNALFTSLSDRMIALRGGAKGLSLAGARFSVDGSELPVAQLLDLAKHLLGGGGAAADDAGGLLDERWGFWLRGNYGFGSKQASAIAPGFKNDQWSLVGGTDYRIGSSFVLGGALAYGKAGVKFRPGDDGSLDTKSWALSLYGTAYAAKNFYIDAVVNMADSNYLAVRNITYVDGSGLVESDAEGETDGKTQSAGVSGGYDFQVGRFTLSPNVGVFYVDANIKGFTESGDSGLNLIYDEQNFKSMTANLGLRATMAWNTSWGSVLPHLRADFIREFKDDVEAFGVRFAADPDAASTPPIIVTTANPDKSYWRLAGGVSAQFRYGISGYVEYQRLQNFELVSYEDISLGLRLQRAF
jgi:outer membrane autotransporter protein